MNFLETERLLLRRFNGDDGAFMCALLNDPAFLKYVGDRGVRNEQDGRAYIESGPVAKYSQNGLGPFIVELKESRTPIGMVSLFKREWLDDADIGFAFMPPWRSQGYAAEAAGAVLDYARTTLALERVVAITSLENPPSIKLLEKLGLTFERIVPSSDGKEQLRLFKIGSGSGIGSGNDTQ